MRGAEAAKDPQNLKSLLLLGCSPLTSSCFINTLGLLGTQLLPSLARLTPGSVLLGVLGGREAAANLLGTPH